MEEVMWIVVLCLAIFMVFPILSLTYPSLIPLSVMAIILGVIIGVALSIIILKRN